MQKEDVAKPDQIPGIFKNLPPVAGAIEAVNVLSEDYDMYILSTAPWHNPSAWQDKLIWLQKYFGADDSNPFISVLLWHTIRALCMVRVVF
ncbi:Putative 5'(3')-deoxyribonucleotidase [Weissella viridescens]|uniref:5'(3')-deoxyribonucleotidase n=1 Tax=Weissella viridescens TaxID=1629 RepID=A0A380NWL2_WEIVI|nr:Putative 5'(3')-deoxyribonucleotidase [Weissella viridescens]